MRMPLVNADGTPVWSPHPDPDIDVAIAHIDVNQLRAHGIYGHVLFSDQQQVLTSRTHASDVGLSEGDECYVLGFPMGHVGGERSFVIVRSGIIARVRDWLAGASKEILIDANIFPGNSGGPVFVRPAATAIVGTSRIDRAWAIGLVSNYLAYQDVAISAQTGRNIMLMMENSGLASVVPFEFVLEAINVFKASSGAQQTAALTPHPDLTAQATPDPSRDPARSASSRPPSSFGPASSAD